MADVPADKPIDTPRGIRHLLFALDRASLYGFGTLRPLWLDSIEHRLGKCSRDVSGAVRAAISQPHFFSDVRPLFSDLPVVGQCALARFSAGNGSAILIERAGRITQGLVVGGW